MTLIMVATSALTALLFHLAFFLCLELNSFIRQGE